MHALLDVAAHPGVAVELREEIERVISEEGWTKDAMTRLSKVDSFMRESLRMNGMSAGRIFVPHPGCTLLCLQTSRCI